MSEIWHVFGSEAETLVATMDWTMPRGVALSCLMGGIFNPVNFALMGKAPVQAGVSLVVGGGSGVREAIQEIGCYNHPHA